MHFGRGVRKPSRAVSEKGLQGQVGRRQLGNEIPRRGSEAVRLLYEDLSRERHPMIVTPLLTCYPANAENRARTDYFEEILNRHENVLRRAGYGGGSSMGMGGPYASASSSSSSLKDIRAYIANNTRDSVAYVREGSRQVEYTNKDKLETNNGRIFNGALIEPYAKLTTIQRSLTGDKTREPKKGVYEREQRDFAGTIPGFSGRGRNEVFLDFNNRVNATLTVTAAALHNLRIFQAGMSSPSLDTYHC